MTPNSLVSAILLQLMLVLARGAETEMLSSASGNPRAPNSSALETILAAPTRSVNNNGDTGAGLPSAKLPDIEQVAKAEALTSAQKSGASTTNNYESCKVQSRLAGLHLSNLSQIQFQPNELCSSWAKMVKFSALDEPQQHQQTPWWHIEQLNLSHNNLTVLQDSQLSGLNRLINLSELKVTHNQLSRCEESALVGLRRLHQLDLSHNRLMALPGKFFQPIKSSLKKLNLSFNSISVLVPSLFDSLAALEHLDLSHNDITSHWITDKLFKDLSQLRSLDLSFNKLTVFSSPMTFSSLQQLETLTLQHNELRQVPETIQHLRFLSSLDLSLNQIHDIANASYQSNCRQLFNLNLESNLLDNITRDAFRDLPALKVLNLANNRIHHLDQQAFEDVPYLHALRLDSNRLIDFGQAFVNLRFLLMLNISSNRISSFDYLQIPSGLQWLDLHSNKIDKLNNYWATPAAQQQFSANDISQSWQSMLRLLTLDASFNLIRDLDNTSLPDSLETVQLNNNQIKSIASQTFSSKSNLTRINLSHNQLSIIPQDALKLQDKSLQSMMIATRDSGQQQQQQQQQKFVDIYLANNPFNCNCNMGWLSQLLLASSTLLNGGHQNLTAQSMLIEHQMILARQMPRVLDAHLITCSLAFARQANLIADGAHLWSPVQAASQLRLDAQVQRETGSLVKRQSELLASVHLCTYKSHCFALCFCCEFDACDCEMSCPDNCSCYYDHHWGTNIVDCSANNQLGAARSSHHAGLHQLMRQPSTLPHQVKFANIPEKIPMDVTELYLDGLELSQLRGNALIGRWKLKTLFLNNSQIYSIEPKALATQKSLKVLQLNSNHLSELHGYEFEQQVELRELYLANNQLSSIANTTFAPLKSLQILHLQNNQLYHMNFWSNLPTGHKLQSLNLGANPWSCQCDRVEPMLQWLQANLRSLYDRKSVGCQFNKTNSLHLLRPLLASSGAIVELDSGYSADDNYPMFEMRMCLNYTVYPAVAASTMAPQHQESSPVYASGAELSQRPSEFADPYATSNAPYNNPPNDEPVPPYINQQPLNSSQYPAQPAQDQFNLYPPTPFYFLPERTPPSSSLGAPLVLVAGSALLVLVVVAMSLLHYRRPVRKWFYSRYGLGMFAASKGAHQHPNANLRQHAGALGSLGKHPHHHHHLQQHQFAANQYGVSSAGSTSSSSAASSQLSHALCHQNQQQAAGLVTTPLIISGASSSHYSGDDERLFDAYITYSKLDEQFVNECIAPELEYSQQAYRVALHHRDLPVTTSEFLPDCIIETANASRRVVLLLSEQLLRSEWTQYEFRAAHLEALAGSHGQRLVIVLLGEPSVLGQLADGELARWLKSCVCIRWGDKMFWPRLRLALPEPLSSRGHQSARYQTLGRQAADQTHRQRLNLGANLLRSAGLFGKTQPQQPPPLPSARPPREEEHHYAHLTPSTMSLYGQQQPRVAPAGHTYQRGDNPTAPVHI